MKKKTVAVLTGIMLMVAGLAGCGQAGGAQVAETSEVQSIETTEEAMTEVIALSEVETAETVEEVSSEAVDEEPEYEADLTIRVGGLKGPTSIGLMGLKDKTDKGEAKQNYEFTMATAADEIASSLVKGDLDIALIPANLASVLYNKTEGKLSVIDINTLGVLYMVSADTSISEPAALAGRTVYLTGKGTTPDYVLQYILKENGLEGQVSLEYKSEAAEVAAVLAEDENAIGLLPQPFVTAAMAKNDKLTVVMDMTAEWDKLQDNGGSRLLTGVTVVNNNFLAEHETAVKAFIYDHAKSTAACSEELDMVAAKTVEEGIIAAEGVAKKAIPECNIVCISGEEMKEALSGYLSVLYDMDASSVGGQLPDENFYFIK